MAEIITLFPKPKGKEDKNKIDQMTLKDLEKHLAKIKKEIQHCESLTKQLKFFKTYVEQQISTFK